jgi:hypothetical protein
MRRGEVEAVLRRDVGRHFLGGDLPRVVGVFGRGRSGGSADPGSPPPVLAAAAPLTLLEEARRAVEAVGWRVGRFTAAQGGWLRAATTARGGAAGAVVAVVGEVAHLMRVEGGVPTAVRRLPSSDPVTVAGALGPGPGRVLVLAPARVGDGLGGALGRNGWVVSRDPEGWGGAEEAAAARAGSAGPELVPPGLARERREGAKAGAAWLGGAALLLLVGAAGVQLWGAQRELATVEARRAEIRDQVAPLLAARDSLDRLAGRVASLDALSQSAPSWTRSLVELSAALPADAHLTELFASGDTVELSAAAARAGEAIQALRESGLFVEVRLMSPVERELAEGETVVERFRLWARVPVGARRGGP